MWLPDRRILNFGRSNLQFGLNLPMAIPLDPYLKSGTQVASDVDDLPISDLIRRDHAGLL